MSYTMATIWSAVVIVLGYAVLDVADAAPGVLTTAPPPPPPVTETPGTRTLPLVRQPTASTSVPAPLPSLAADADAPTPEGVERALADLRASSAFAEAALVVRDGQDGRALLDQDESTPRIPASTTKLLSAAAVGRVFDGDQTLRTEVRAGAGAGDIVLVAGGDSLIAPGAGDPDAVAGRAGLRDLADQVASRLEAADVDRVRLSVDESYADGPLLAPTWGADYRKDAITGPVSMLGLTTQRASKGRPALADPVASVRDLLARQLRAKGIDVTVEPRPAALARRATRDNTAEVPAPQPSPSAATGPGAVLGSIESAPVRDQLALALTDSDNALTEVLARQAAYRAGAGTDFAAVGAWVVSEVAALGLDTSGTTLVDASGLSRQNRIRADLLADVLVLGYDGRHPTLRRALDGMPVAGLTGTLATRLAGEDHAAAGRARAKTGTLTGANALAGSVVDDDGRLLVFVGMVAGTGTEDARAALDRFVATVAACGCR